MLIQSKLFNNKIIALDLITDIGYDKYECYYTNDVFKGSFLVTIEFIGGGNIENRIRLELPNEYGDIRLRKDTIHSNDKYFDIRKNMQSLFKIEIEKTLEPLISEWKKYKRCEEIKII